MIQKFRKTHMDIRKIRLVSGHEIFPRHGPSKNRRKWEFGVAQAILLLIFSQMSGKAIISPAKPWVWLTTKEDFLYWSGESWEVWEAHPHGPHGSWSEQDSRKKKKISATVYPFTQMLKAADCEKLRRLMQCKSSTLGWCRLQFTPKNWGNPTRSLIKLC